MFWYITAGYKTSSNKRGGSNPGSGCEARMKEAKKYIQSANNAYEQRQSLLLVGLTGRTGSGCSTTAKILSTRNFSELDLRSPKVHDFTSREERKYGVIHRYMSAEGRWRPFTVIEVSDIILSFIIENGYDAFCTFFLQYENVDENNTVRISAFKEVFDIVKGMRHMFDNCELCKLDGIKNILQDEERAQRYYDFYTDELPRLKKDFRMALNEYTCHKEVVDRFSQTRYEKSHLYTFVMQTVGNNVRCSGNPYDTTYTENNFYDVAKRIEAVIKLIKWKNGTGVQTRICIDAIRNPYEGYYFKDKYSSFYMVSINTEEQNRKERLSKLDRDEQSSLDNVEFNKESEHPYDIFSHQDMQECLSISDIHLYNLQVSDNRYFTLTEQLLKYVALMLCPGLIAPTHIERCMQTAHTASLNSGCLSRQVGAVITGEDFSIKAVGWNEVPEGQIPCNLRCINDYCKNKDSETYSAFELEDEQFQKAVKKINDYTREADLEGVTFSYCFKDIYNGITRKDNQVFTRALHAEENAFLQLSKNGGQGIKGGKLFTTASPCELCAKKAYQLGIKEIYYIDPYPGISIKHILSFGASGNPRVQLFSGAIGGAYARLYKPRIPKKDELRLRVGKSCKQILLGDENGFRVITDLKNKSLKNTLTFLSRTNIEEISESSIEVLAEEVSQVSHKQYWTGSSFDGIDLQHCSVPHNCEYKLGPEPPYACMVSFDPPLKKGACANFGIKTKVKDMKCIMSPYYAQMITAHTEKLVLKVVAPEKLITGVETVVYADLAMGKDYEVERRSVSAAIENGKEHYIFEVDNPNLMYSYCLEWKFAAQDEKTIGEIEV